jgi:ArsR family transcriptional regulator, arsenate/arsenite/antimonite-responsive transcriptional repressor
MFKHVNDKETTRNCCTEEFLDLQRALSDETRQQILALFTKNKELCVTDIANNFTLSRPTISHHLNIMKRVKLLNSRKEGKEMYYSFNRDYVIKAIESFLNFLKTCC